MAEEMSALKTILQVIGLDTSTLASLGDPQDGIYYLLVAYDQTLETWKELRKTLPTSGYWPVILTTELEIDEIKEQMKDYRYSLYDTDGVSKSFDATPQAIIARGITLDPVEWQQKQVKDPYGTGESSKFLHGDWPEPRKLQEPDDPDPYTEIMLPFYPNYEDPAPNVVISLCPTPHSWQTPAYLRFGGVNSCPHPDEHVGLFKYWHERYGAEIVAMGTDVLQAYIPFPPSHRADAIVLAQTLLRYDHDLDEGKTVEQFADRLMRKILWFFWWD